MSIGIYMPQERGGVWTRERLISENIPEVEIFHKISDAKKYDLLDLQHQQSPRLWKYPFIETFHGLLPLKYCTNFHAKLSMLRYHIWKRMSLKKAKKVICVSQEARRQIAWIPQKKIKVIHAGIPVERYERGKKENKIMFLNSLEKYENGIDLIKAGNNLLGKYPIKMYGEGRLEKEYKELAGHNIQILNEVSNDIIKQELSTSKCLVHCPLQETFGIPIIEAMASGTITIVSDIPSHRELFKNVLFYDPGDIPRLSELIEEVMRGEHNYLIEPALQEVKDKYNLSQMIKKTKEVYDEVESWSRK